MEFLWYCGAKYAQLYSSMNEWKLVQILHKLNLLQCGISAFGPKYQTKVYKCILVEWTEFTDLKTYVNIFKEFKIVYLLRTLSIQSDKQNTT